MKLFFVTCADSIPLHETLRALVHGAGKHDVYYSPVPENPPLDKSDNKEIIRKKVHFKINDSCWYWHPCEYDDEFEPYLHEYIQKETQNMDAFGACVLCVPCGRYAYLIAKLFLEKGKPLYILLYGDSGFDLSKHPKAKICHNVRDLIYKIFIDECLMQLDNPTWDWRTDNEKEKQIRINSLKDEMSKIFVDKNMLRHLLLTSKPKEFAEFFAKQFIIELPDKRVIIP